MKFSRAISRVKWLNDEKNSVSKTIFLLVLGVLISDGLRNAVFFFFIVQPLDPADSPREFHYTQSPGKHQILRFGWLLERKTERKRNKCANRHDSCEMQINALHDVRLNLIRYQSNLQAHVSIKQYDIDADISDIAVTVLTRLTSIQDAGRPGSNLGRGTVYPDNGKH
jgi:hypothetical protein